MRRLIELKIDPQLLLRRPTRYLAAPWIGLTMLPRRCSRGPVLAHETTIGQLPQLKSWPDDGGAFVTLPQVYTEDVEQPGLLKSNLGMYRVQLSGGRYEPDREVGMHYQLHRTIGVHHAAALRQGEPFRVNVFVGGTPAMMLAAVMPLPEGMSELTFAGALAGHRIPMICPRRGAKADGDPQAAAAPLPIYAEADFCIAGTIDPDKKLPEGPFGDHLGYYSLAHDFPVLRVEHVYHRDGAIWPFTVVGRPPQEDTMFGELIHELTGPVIPQVIPGVHAVHAVDAAGVHPLLLAIGSERYTPYETLRRPQELLTQANAILGQGQLSLAKYLLIAARDDDPQLDVHDIPGFLPARAGARGLAARSAFPDAHHDRHAGLLRQRAERRLEGRDRRRRLRRGEVCRRSCPAICSCPPGSASRASACPACWPSRDPRRSRPAARRTKRSSGSARRALFRKPSTAFRWWSWWTTATSRRAR